VPNGGLVRDDLLDASRWTRLAPRNARMPNVKGSTAFGCGNAAMNFLGVNYSLLAALLLIFSPPVPNAYG